MADPRGFLKTTERVDRPKRPVPVRIMDFAEVQTRQDPSVIHQQAGRCMDCGIPFCHSGCPLGNLIPEWNDLAWRGDWHDAIERLHEEFKRRIKTQCLLPCAETACMLFWALLASGQITLRRVDGWDTLHVAPADEPLDLAA